MRTSLDMDELWLRFDEYLDAKYTSSELLQFSNNNLYLEMFDEWLQAQDDILEDDGGYYQIEYDSWKHDQDR